MIDIANIPAEKELDSEEMSNIQGGMDIFSNAGRNANVQSGVSFASPQVNVAPVTQIDASQHTDVDVKSVTKSVDALGSMVSGIKI